MPKKIWAGRNGPREDGKAPGGIFRGDVYRFMAETEKCCKRELLREKASRSIAQRLAEGRTQAARGQRRLPASPVVKESGMTDKNRFGTKCPKHGGGPVPYDGSKGSVPPQHSG